MTSNLRIICTSVLVLGVVLASTGVWAQEAWTGISVSVGGGASVLSSGVNSEASRTDELGLCLDASCDGAGFLSVATLDQSRLVLVSGNR